MAAARRLAELHTVAIVTGQQAGLFGGPLYTLLKAATAIGLAAQITREYDVNVVPVFWIDAEDHDWEEVRSCAVLDADMQVSTITAEVPEGAGERMIASLRWTDRIQDATRALFDAVPTTEFTPWLTEIVQRAYAPGRGVSESFARMLDTVLGPHGLIVYDASDQAAKPLVAGLFAREFEQPGRTSALAARAGSDLVLRGYRRCHLFIVSPRID